MAEHADTLREEDVEVELGGTSHFSIPRDSFCRGERGQGRCIVCTSLHQPCEVTFYFLDEVKRESQTSDHKEIPASVGAALVGISVL